MTSALRFSWASLHKPRRSSIAAVMTWSASDEDAVIGVAPMKSRATRVNSTVSG